MRFSELKERSNANHAEEDRLRALGRREWICPDNYTVINVQLNPWNDDEGVSP